MLCLFLTNLLFTVPLGTYCLQVSKNRFQPQLIVYNAGTDILDGDPLGKLEVLFSYKLLSSQAQATEATSNVIMQ